MDINKFQEHLSGIGVLSSDIDDLISHAQSESSKFQALGLEDIAQIVFESELNLFLKAISAWKNDFGYEFRIDPLVRGRHKGCHPVKFTCEGEVWVYKPRSGQAELVLQKLFSIFQCEKLYVPTILDKGEYHWSRWVDETHFDDAHASFWFGQLWCIFSLLGACDMHDSNVIKTDKGLCIIDAETLFDPIRDGVNFTSLLTYRNCEKRLCPLHLIETNVDSLVQGVKNILDLIRSQPELIEISSHLLSGVATRLVTRSNEVYENAWRRLSHVGSASFRDELVDFLDTPVLSHQLDSEICDLLRGDDPITYFLDGKIFSSHWENIGSSERSIEKALNDRVHALKIESFEWIIALSFYPNLFQKVWIFLICTWESYLKWVNRM